MNAELAALVHEPIGQGPLEDATHTSDGENPVCGDRLRFEARLTGQRIESLRFRATACPACIATASCAVRVLEGREVPVAKPIALLRAELARCGGLSAFEQHALALVEDVVIRCFRSHLESGR